MMETRKIFWASIAYIFILTPIILQTSLGLIPTGVLGALFIIIVGFILGFIQKIANKNTFSTTFNWFYFISRNTIVSLIMFYALAFIQTKITKNRAEELIVAIELYKTLESKVPQRLEDLTPVFLTTPKTDFIGFFHQDFEYIKTSQTTYKINFYGFLGVEYRYNSFSKEWIVDD